MTPIPPSLSFLCAHLGAAISSILLQNVLNESSNNSSDSLSSRNFFLAEHLRRVIDGDAAADQFTPAVLTALNFIRNFEDANSMKDSAFARSNMSAAASSVISQFFVLCQKLTELEKRALLFASSMDVCLKALLGPCVKAADPPIKANATSNSFSVEEIAASSNFIKNITSSSSASATRFMLSSNWEEVWTSEGAQGTHWICIELVDGVCAKDAGICVQTDDSSWCPKVITVRAAETLELMKAKPKATLDYTSLVSRGGRHFLKALDCNSGALHPHFEVFDVPINSNDRCFNKVH